MWESFLAKGRRVMVGNEKRLFPYAAIIRQETDTFSIRYPLYPDIVAYGKPGSDDPQTLAEDLFCVILDLAAHGEVEILPPQALTADEESTFAVRVTPRLVKYLASYDLRLAPQPHARLVSTRIRTRFAQLAGHKGRGGAAECHSADGTMTSRRKLRADKRVMLNRSMVVAEG